MSMSCDSKPVSTDVYASFREVKALRRYRRIHDVKLLELAKVANLSAGTISLIETGQRRAKRSEVRKLRSLIDQILREQAA